MKKNSRLVLVLAVFILALSGAAAKFSSSQDPKPKRYMINYGMKSPVEGRKLMGWLMKNGFDVAGMNWRKGTVEVITSDEGIAFLNEKGLKGYILPTPKTALDPRYLNPEKVEAKLKDLAAKNPSLTRLEKIGTSHEGRPIWGLLVSSTPGKKDESAHEKPSIIIDGMHHAREIMTPEVVMDIAEMLISGVNQHKETAEKLLDRWNVWVVPMLNVDGNNKVWTGQNMWRKNAWADKGTVWGVDLNRNYPFEWNGCDGSSGSKSSDVYRGPSVASEPETQAMMKLADKVKPAANLSYHSYSELIIYPYGCDGSKSSEHQLLSGIANQMAKLLPSDSNPNEFYTPGLGWEILYAVDGDSADYFHGHQGALSYVFEINQDFQPPYSLREPTLKKHRRAWIWFLKHTSQNMLRVQVTDGKTQQPADATVEFAQIKHSKGEKPFVTNAGGYFFKVLAPGSYDLTVTLKDGRNAKTSVVMEGNQRKSIEVVVQ